MQLTDFYTPLKSIFKSLLLMKKKTITLTNSAKKLKKQPIKIAAENLKKDAVKLLFKFQLHDNSFVLPLQDHATDP